MTEHVSLGAFEQVCWERDVAIDQLKQLGYGFGEKIQKEDQKVSREKYRKIRKKYKRFKRKYIELKRLISNPVLKEAEVLCKN